jgi:hypothetical protein
MKARLTMLLIGALAAFAPALSAQRRADCVITSVSSAYYRGSYESSRVWIPGRYDWVSRRVFVPGPVQREWVAPVFEWRFGPCGAQYVCVREGYWRTIQQPGHYEYRRERVYQPGHWAARGRG